MTDGSAYEQAHPTGDDAAAAAASAVELPPDLGAGEPQAEYPYPPDPTPEVDTSQAPPTVAALPIPAAPVTAAPAPQVPLPRPPRPRMPTPHPPTRAQRPPTQAAPGPAATQPATTAPPIEAQHPEPLRSDPSAWGRVTDEGTVYVRTADGEREVGSWAAGAPREALEFYGRRFDALLVEVELLERRIRDAVAKPDEAMTSIRHARSHVAAAAAVGDLDSLSRRLDDLEAVVAEQRTRRREERARAQQVARDDKEELVKEAEAIAEGRDWRAGADQLQALLVTWRKLPRLDKAADDALWQRFSAARTAYTRQRRAHFAEQADHRNAAKTRKLAIAAEAEALATSTDWGPASARFRAMMIDWKSAGPAPRTDEDALWRRFRAAHDAFFASRTSTFSERDRSETDNQRLKEALLVRAEALLPVTDLTAARAALREIHDGWAEAGRVPRAAIALLEARLRKVEEAIRSSEQAEWHRTSPEALARAETTVDRLRTAVEKLERTLAKADAQGDAIAASAAREALEARRAWLTEAEKTLAEFRR